MTMAGEMAGTLAYMPRNRFGISAMCARRLTSHSMGMTAYSLLSARHGAGRRGQTKYG